MTVYFQASSASFYDTAHYDQSVIPSDVVKVTAARYKKLLADICAGFTIKADADGKPVSIDPATLLTDDQRMAMIRGERDRLLSACDHIMMPDYPIDDVRRANWASYRQLLRDMPGLWADDLANIIWPPPPA